MDRERIVCRELLSGRKSLRIAVVTETYPPEVNGVAMTISRMVEGLKERGHCVQLVRPRQDPQDGPASNANFSEVLVRGIAIPRYDTLKMGLPAGGSLLRLWSATRPDIVHVVTEGPLGWSAVSAAMRLGIPCSSDFHTNFHSYSKHYGLGWLAKPVVGYLRKFHNRSNSTLVPIAALAERLRHEGYRDLRVVSRGVDTQLFHPNKRSALLRQRWGVEPQQPVVLYVGRLAAEKNLALLLRAFSAMRLLRPDALLVLVGDGPQRAALQAAHPDCRFAGQRTGEDLAAHYASGDVFLFPSVTETYGNVTVEAMASGLAVVAYDYAAAALHIGHGRNGLIADFDNARDLIRLAAGLIVDPERIAQLGRRARETAERIDWNCVHDEFAAALHETIAAKEFAHAPRLDD